jgi:hypothetical protein
MADGFGTIGGEPLRVASWWALPEIPSTVATTPVGCWDASLAKPGPSRSRRRAP